MTSTTRPERVRHQLRARALVALASLALSVALTGALTLLAAAVSAPAGTGSGW